MDRLLLGAPIALALLGTAEIAAQVPAGTDRTFTLTLTSQAYGNTRAVRVHLPPGYHEPGNEDRRYRLLLMGDGFALFSPTSWNAPAVVDSLIALGEIEPLVLVGVDNAASIPGVENPGQARANEYLPYTDPLEPELESPMGERFPDFVIDEVLPLVRARVRLTDSREGMVLGGSSYSAIAALYAAARIGDRFGGILLESPPVFLFGERLTRELEAAEHVPDRLYVGIGTMETPDTVLLATGDAAIERLIRVARAKGLETRLLRVEGATHDSRSWSARFPEALRFLFPPGQR